MNLFYETPVLNAAIDKRAEEYLVVMAKENLSITTIKQALSANKLVLIKATSFEKAGTIFSDLVDLCGLRESYELQMQYVVHMIAGREALDDIAVTVNERAPYQFIQAHSEGDSSSPLDILALHCTQNSNSGGENIFSLINQSADYSNLRAKEKVIVGTDLDEIELRNLKMRHRDAKLVVDTFPEQGHVLFEYGRGSVVVRPIPVQPTNSLLSGEKVITYWDNVTVHDHAFHRHQFDLLEHLNIIHQPSGADYKLYMHLEEDSDWAPADSDSGTTEQTAKLFSCHVLFKMEAGDFLILNNRTWTHSVNNWPPTEVRILSAMYA